MLRVIERVRVKKITKFGVDIAPLWLAICFVCLNGTFFVNGFELLAVVGLSLAACITYFDSVLWGYLTDVRRSWPVIFGALSCQAIVVMAVVVEWSAFPAVVSCAGAALYVVVSANYRLAKLKALGYEVDGEDPHK